MDRTRRRGGRMMNWVLEKTFPWYFGDLSVAETVKPRSQVWYNYATLSYQTRSCSYRSREIHSYHGLIVMAALRNTPSPRRNLSLTKQTVSVACYLVTPVPWHRRSMFGRRVFSVAGPMSWNSLPDCLDYETQHVLRTAFGVISKLFYSRETY